MPELVPYGEAQPWTPSHRCDECQEDIYVWPIPWQLAWPDGRGRYLCTPCYLRKKKGGS